MPKKHKNASRFSTNLSRTTVIYYIIYVIIYVFKIVVKAYSHRYAFEIIENLGTVQARIPHMALLVGRDYFFNHCHRGGLLGRWK